MLVITVEGGLVQSVSSDDPVEQGNEAVVIDYDAEGADPADVERIPQGDGDADDAVVSRMEVGILYAPIAEHLKEGR